MNVKLISSSCNYCCFFNKIIIPLNIVFQETLVTAAQLGALSYGYNSTSLTTCDLVKLGQFSTLCMFLLTTKKMWQIMTTLM